MNTTRRSTWLLVLMLLAGSCWANNDGDGSGIGGTGSRPGGIGGTGAPEEKALREPPQRPDLPERIERPEFPDVLDRGDVFIRQAPTLPVPPPPAPDQ